MAASLMAGASAYALGHTGPLFVGEGVNILAAGAWSLLIVSSAIVLGEAFTSASKFAEWIAANRPKKLKGTADWVKSLSEVRHDLIAQGWGPFWGAFPRRSLLPIRRREEVMADIQSNALILGTAGSGKGVTWLQNNALSIKDSKIVLCFKGENTCVLAGALHERGETICIINLGDLFTDLLGEGDSYNVLSLIADNYWRRGGLLDISDDTHELNMQLLPEPKSSKGDDGYFRNGSRDMLAFAIQFCIITFEDEVSLGDVELFLSDRSEILLNAQWVAGKLPRKDPPGSFSKLSLDQEEWVGLHDPHDAADYIDYFRGLAAKVAGLLENNESKSADAFLTGAQQALARFNRATRAHRKTSRSTFHPDQLKEGDNATTLFLIIDASRIEAQAPVASLIQWGLFTSLKRHPNKDRAVHVLADEATNFKIHGLVSLLTWGRGYGIRLYLLFQALSAFTEQYGEAALAILLSETEIKLFLPGQRDPKTIKLIKELLFQRAVVTRSRRGNREKGWFDAAGIDYREDEIPLMNEDEIRRTDKAIFFLKRNKPMLLEPIKIAEIDPFRDMVDINPFHGKPFLLPVKLKLNRDRLSLAGLLKRWLFSPRTGQ
ncbi:MAG: type IV secretory system conjugative DNA transfer family protein [Pseudomonadota bacterium]